VSETLKEYVNLIDQLLWCESGEEVSVLQRHTRWVNERLLEVMQQEIEQLVRRQKTEAANRLQNIQKLVTKNIENKIPVGQTDEERERSQSALNFVSEVMQFIEKEQNNKEQVYAFFRLNLTRFDEVFLEALPIVFRKLLFQNHSAARENIAASFGNFSSLIRQFPLGDRALNLEIGIVASQLILQVYTREAFPKKWATTHNNLALAYLYRIRGERADNLEQAITLCEQALQIRTREVFPEDCAMTQNNLAAVYLDRIRGERASNIEQSITLFEQALRVRTYIKFPEEWAMTQHNLANAYLDRIRGERAENIELAITLYEQTLQVRTYEMFPEQWAMTQNGLANAYSNRIRGDRADNLEIAIVAYTKALQVRTCELFPELWAMTQHNLAAAYRDRIRGDCADNLEQAILACERALQVHTRDAFPQNWAVTQSSLASVYRNRIRGNRADNLEQAIAACENALQIYTREAFPQDWAMMQINLAAAYRDRIKGDHADNLEQAILACENALQIYTREKFSKSWAMTQNHLAIAYGNRIKGERVDNLEQAIAAFEKALTIYTYEAFPQDWASSQNSLANAYGKRIKGKRADNIEMAIAAFEKALLVYTCEAFPQDWAMTQSNLANAYGERIRGDRAYNLEQAITLYKQALQIRTYEAFPEDWAMTKNNLALAYVDRIQGERSDNLEQAIATFQSALLVYTREAFPKDWAGIQNNLAAAYRDRMQGNQANNLEQSITAFQLALQIYTCEAFPKECRMVARSLANLLFSQQAWDAAVQIYAIALSAAETLYQNCLFLEGQSAEISETGDLYHRAAYAYAKSGNFQTALLTHELGRARGLSDSLIRDRTNLAQLKTINPILHDRYQDLTQQLRVLEAQQRNPDTNYPDQIRSTLIQTRQALTETIATIQQVEGYQTFLKPLTFTDVTHAVPLDRAIVYVATTPAGSLALVLTPSTDIYPIWLNDLTPETLQQFVSEWFIAYSKQNNRQAWLNAIDQGTQTLWDILMGAIVQKLTDLNLSQAVLIPTGYLGLLPLHAAWTPAPNTPTGGRYALDTIQFTYAPNARSLEEAQKIRDRVTADSLLAIDNPTQDLANAEKEIESAVNYFGDRTLLRHSQATRAAVLTALPQHTVLHCACHGTANLTEPLNSGLAMSDGLLTLRDILALQLAQQSSGGIRLAILSACETGLSGIENIDEVISLPTGLLQAGVAGITASFWAVSDLSTMMLIARFYDYWQVEQLDLDRALRQAQIWVRDTTNEEKIVYLENQIPELSGQRMPISVVQKLYKAIALESPNDRGFAHPYFWAAFGYFGV
jgi:CHAT domain-containing protein